MSKLLLSRRAALFGAAALLGNGGAARASGAGAANPADERIVELEKRAGGRLGVAVLDTATRERLQHRADERFAMCSTFKYLAAAATLERVDRGQERLDRWIAYDERDLLEYAPVTRQHVREHGMRLAELCAAAVEMSDNTAGNLLLRIIGGPATVTQYCRSLGDRVTRLDRTEPTLNQVAPGDSRDTTTPAAMVRLLHAIFCGSALSADSRQRLQTWMLDAKVGQERLPAGLPGGWLIGHKTGTGPRETNETNDVAIVWPPKRAPILIAAFYAQSRAPQEGRDAVLREVAQIVAAAL